MGRIFTTLLLGLSVIISTTPLYAQTGPRLLIEPWPDDVQLQFRPSVQTWWTHVKGSDNDADFILIRDSARYRLDPADDRSPALGYDVYAMRIRSNEPALPSRLIDVSLGTGLLLHEDEQLTVSMPIAVGLAGVRPFSEPGRAVYAKASIMAFKRLDQRSQLMLAIEYNGNRTFLPDVPLPGIAYIRQLDNTLRLTVGVPQTGIRWQPNERLELTLNYYLLTEFDAEVQYHFTPEWSLFASLDSDRRAFHEHGDNRNRRLFFTQRRAEVGVRWDILDDIELVAAGGYSFGSRLDRGYDVRDLDTVSRFSDTPYLRVGLSMAF